MFDRVLNTPLVKKLSLIETGSLDSTVFLSSVRVYVPNKNLRTLDFERRLYVHKSFASRLN